MRPEIKKLLHRIYAIAFPVATVLVGLCLMGGCYYIYASGQGYSPALISAVFSKISLPVWLWLAMALGGIVLHVALPQKETKKASAHTKNAVPTKPRSLRLSYVLLALGIVLVILGVWGDGLSGVIAKAVAICTECIGLG